jgi:hypothetical protein
MNATLSDIHAQARVQFVTDYMRFSSTERHHIDGCKDDVGTFIEQESQHDEDIPHAGRLGRC